MAERAFNRDLLLGRINVLQNSRIAVERLNPDEVPVENQLTDVEELTLAYTWNFFLASQRMPSYREIARVFNDVSIDDRQTSTNTIHYRLRKLTQKGYMVFTRAGQSRGYQIVAVPDKLDLFPNQTTVIAQEP